MRGFFAAACAAILVGLSPAGALPLASLAAAAVSRIEAACGATDRPLREVRGQESREARSGAVTRSGESTRVRAVFRSPSGPAPSQAPPAA